MSASKPLLRALRGESQERTPVWLMRQAGRYLPEYRALRAKATGFVEFCLNPELATEVTLQPVRRFDLDGAILFADILLVPHALGQRVEFRDGEGPRLEPIRDAEDLAELSERLLHETLAPVMETIKGVRAELPPETTLIGFAGAPWTVATYMIEGCGGTDYEHSRRMMWSQPELFGELIDLLVDATISYLGAQVEAGAEALQLFDSWAGAVPAALFERAVVAPTARIVEALKSRFPHVPIIGFPRAASLQLAHYAAQTGVNAVGVDHMTDLASVAVAVPRRVAVQGNLDPVLLLVGGQAMRDETRRLLTTMKGRPFIFNLGHGVLQPTPPEHVTELVSFIRSSA